MISFDYMRARRLSLVDGIWWHKRSVWAWKLAIEFTSDVRLFFRQMLQINCWLDGECIIISPTIHGLVGLEYRRNLVDNVKIGFQMPNKPPCSIQSNNYTPRLSASQLNLPFELHYLPSRPIRLWRALSIKNHLPYAAV